MRWLRWSVFSRWSRPAFHHVNHHGSDATNGYVFLRAVMPTYAVISVGAGNPYGHPSEETLARLRDVSATIFRTDASGTIECVRDGSNVRFINDMQKQSIALMATK